MKGGEGKGERGWHVKEEEEEMKKRGKTNVGEKTRRREDESGGRRPKQQEGRKRLERINRASCQSVRPAGPAS